MTFLESKQELARKLNINYANIASNQLFSDTDLGAWIQLGLIDVWDFHPWPFTQGVKTATTTSATDYYDAPQDFVMGSIFLLKVNGVEYKKLLFEDYSAWFQLNPTDTTPLWSEYGGFIFINKNAYTAGQTFDLYGKKTAPQLVNPTDLLPFSPVADAYEYSGNQAIVLFAYAHAQESEKKQQPQVADAIRGEALGILKSLWKVFADERATLQSTNRPMFNVPDFFRQHGSSSNPGNFNI